MEPEAYDCVTIFFSDVPDFQNICTKLDPLEVSAACFWRSGPPLPPVQNLPICTVPCWALHVDCELYVWALSEGREGPAMIPVGCPGDLPWWPAC